MIYVYLSPLETNLYNDFVLNELINYAPVLEIIIIYKNTHYKISLFDFTNATVKHRFNKYQTIKVQ
jgi:hypothetical protein